MPDEYMNLTDAEAAELGYGVARLETGDPLNGLGEEIIIGLLVFLTACLFVAGLWSAIHPSDSASTFPITVTTANTGAVAVNPRTASQPAPPQHSAADQLESVPQAYPTPARQYVPDGWNHGTAVGPIRLFHGESVAAIIPAGIEFLCSWGTVHGWSYVIALDGESWGLGALAPSSSTPTDSPATQV